MESSGSGRWGFRFLSRALHKSNVGWTNIPDYGHHPNKFTSISMAIKKSEVSDKYAGPKDALIDVPQGGGFADMVALVVFLTWL